MFFQLRKLILWPRSERPPRVIDFQPGVVNVISGTSKTGKSAVIPIIDYCLGAGKCAIPVGTIRETCAWFGVVVDTWEGQKLLARREPGNYAFMGDMFLIEADEVELPATIPDKNTNVDFVKETLDRLAGLTSLGFDPDSESGFKARPSFRDLMAFTFQPQNIVANPDVMFFKADTTEHREKLKTIFPYVLGAIDASLLQTRFELDRLSRSLRRKESELRTLVLNTTRWRAEAQAWLRQAIEFGLLPADQKIPDVWLELLALLRRVAAVETRTTGPTLAGIDTALGRLEELRKQETNWAETLTEHRQRMNELRRLQESSDAYGGAIRVQRDRLALADWLRDLQQDVRDPLVSLGAGDHEQLSTLCEALDSLEVQLRTHPTMTETLDREALRQRAAADAALSRLTQVRSEIALLERASEEARAAADQYHQVDRFIGRLLHAIKLYDEADESAGLNQEISDLREQIRELQRRVSEQDIERRQRNALNRIQAFMGGLTPQLDAEWPDAPARLVIEDLMVKVLREHRDDYLWEIGSGSNWLTYHVALTLALQKFFLGQTYAPVPGLLVYDQPSQVYFPKSATARDMPDIPFTDEDVVAVKKVFTLLGKEAVAANGRLQFIVLDHAEEDVWGGLPGVQLAHRWRGDALVPADWLTR